jgi:8-oxo-dGTP pyrophosphatase MutT (NUDIX family)
VSSQERRFDEPEIARLKERIADHQPVEINEPGVRRAAVALIIRPRAQAAATDNTVAEHPDAGTDPRPAAAVSAGSRGGADRSIPIREPQLLFIQRAHYERDPWSGQVAFPGGREEPGDASLMETALRETFEETGLDIRRHGEVIGQLDDLGPQTPRLPPVVVRPFVAVIDSNSELSLSDEVAAYFWVPLEALRLDTSWRDTVVTARGMEFTRRAFHHQGFVVWGMTERILSHFLNLLH